jgi:hypothetical protein
VGQFQLLGFSEKSLKPATRQSLHTNKCVRIVRILPVAPNFERTFFQYRLQRKALGTQFANVGEHQIVPHRLLWTTAEWSGLQAFHVAYTLVSQFANGKPPLRLDTKSAAVGGRYVL